MRLTIEDTNADTENKQKGVIECEKDGIDVDNIMSMVVRAMLAYGYDRPLVAEWFKDLAATFTERDEKDES